MLLWPREVPKCRTRLGIRRQEEVIFRLSTRSPGHARVAMSQTQVVRFSSCNV